MAEIWLITVPQLGQRLGDVPLSSLKSPSTCAAMSEVGRFFFRILSHLSLELSAYYIQSSKRIADGLPFFWCASVIHLQFLEPVVYCGLRGLNTLWQFRPVGFKEGALYCSCHM
jgi:hypothetical protein